MTVAQIRVEKAEKRNGCRGSFDDKLAEVVFELIVEHKGNKGTRDNFYIFVLVFGNEIMLLILKKTEEFQGNKKILF
jgi:hypothetical protein